MRSKLRALLIGTLVLVAACGGGGDDEEEAATTSTTDAPADADEATEDVVASEGEGTEDDGTDDDATEDGATATEASEGSDDEASSGVAALEGSLLALDDMPVGWTEAPELLDDGDEDEGECSFDAGLDEGSRAQAAFKAGESGPFVLHAIGGFRDEAEVEGFMADFAAFAERCQSYEEAGVTTTMSPMSFTELGDESLAYRMTVDDPAAVPIELDVVLWRSGDRASILGVFSAAEPPDPALTQELADVAAARV